MKSDRLFTFDLVFACLKDKIVNSTMKHSKILSTKIIQILVSFTINTLMKIIEDIIRTFLGHDEDILGTDEEFDETLLGQEKDKGNDLACEQAIIKCQMRHGRLRATTTRLCQAKFGKDTTKRAQMRLAMRKKRGNNAVKDMEQDLVNLITKVMDLKNKQDLDKSGL